MSSTQRFYVPPSAILGDKVRFSPEQSLQICSVLRLSIDDAVTVFDNTGAEYHIELTLVNKKACAGVVCLTTYPNTEVAKPLHLWHGILKPKAEAILLQKASELGVTDIHPLLTERTVQRTFNSDHFERIIQEACEVVGRVKLPMLHPVSTLTASKEALEKASNCLILLAWEEADPSTQGLKDVLTLLEENSYETIHCIIGPEGGFSKKEVELFDKVATVVSLGNRVMRAETAGIVFVANVGYQFFMGIS